MVELAIAFIIFVLLVWAIFLDVASVSVPMVDPAENLPSVIFKRDDSLDKLKSEVESLRRDVDRLRNPNSDKKATPEETINTIIELLSTLVPPSTQ